MPEERSRDVLRIPFFNCFRLCVCKWHVLDRRFSYAASSRGAAEQRRNFVAEILLKQV